MRVITNQIEISDNKEELEQNANFELLGINAIQQTAKIARGGDVLKAQVHAKAWNKRMRKNVDNEEKFEMLSNY